MKRMSLFLLSTLVSLCCLAQEKSGAIEVNVGKDSGGNWGAPWMWVVGAAAFILILVAIIRAGRN